MMSHIHAVTYRNVIILEALSEDLENGLLVLSLDDTRGSRENAVCGLPQAGLGALTCLEQHTEKFGPLFACK